MLNRTSDVPQGLQGLTASGTVIGGDVKRALGDLAPGSRLAVSVEPGFDGYMIELVRGLGAGCASGVLARCALIVPDDMLAEARLHRGPEALRAFPAAERGLAERWAMG